MVGIQIRVRVRIRFRGRVARDRIVYEGQRSSVIKL